MVVVLRKSVVRCRALRLTGKLYLIMLIHTVYCRKAKLQLLGIVGRSHTLTI